MILIADTLSYILDLLATAFQLDNFALFTATLAKERIVIYVRVILKNSIDMALMDVAIAGDHGVGEIINIRRLKPDHKIMVVIEEENVKAMAMRVGTDAVVMEPIPSDMVLHQVKDILMQTETFLDKKRSKFQQCR